MSDEKNDLIHGTNFTVRPSTNHVSDLHPQAENQIAREEALVDFLDVVESQIKKEGTYSETLKVGKGIIESRREEDGIYPWVKAVVQSLTDNQAVTLNGVKEFVNDAIKKKPKLVLTWQDDIKNGLVRYEFRKRD